MKNTLSSVFLLILIFATGCNSKPNYNKVELTAELDSILVVDQKYRLQMQEVQEEYGWNSPEMGALWNKQSKIDSSNVKRIIEIIEMVEGYPGKSLVGASASKTTFYVLQHAADSVQDEYFDLIMNAASEGELDKSLAAMYQDRYLMHRDEPQIFGTQIRSEYRTDSITDERKQVTFIWPIADTTNIDSLRATSGLGPLEEYVNRFGLSRWD